MANKQFVIAGSDSEELLRQSQRVARLGHYVMDIPADCWTCSEMLDEIFGLTGVGQRSMATWAALFHPDHRKEMTDYFLHEVIGQHREFDREYRIINQATGQALWVHGKGSLEFGADGSPVRMFGTIQDITARKNVELALSESEARMKSIFESVTEGLVVATEHDHRIVLCNRSFAELLGCSVAEATRLCVEDIHRPEDLKYALGQFMRQVRREITLASDIPLMRRDGRVVSCDVNSVPIVINGEPCIMGSFRDNTARKIAEHELRLKKFVFNSAMTANSIADIDGMIVEVNQAFLRIWGFSRFDEVLGKKVPEFLVYEHEAQAIMQSITASGAWAGEYTAKRPDGSTFLASSQATVIRNERDEIVGYQSSVLDISAQKEAEAERDRLEAQLRHMQKMDAIGRLAGGVAHDFNNQLTGILGFAELLSHELTEPRHKEFAEYIQSAARRAADLTAKLLAFARKGKYQMIPVDLHEIISETAEMLRHSIDRRINIEQVFWDGTAVVMGDPTQLQSALLNIALNARDAMPEGGTLTFETRLARLPSKPNDHSHQEDATVDHLVLTVTDTGCGMTDVVKAHLFEPFFTTKPIGQGTGMGLAATYGTVENHRGGIHVESEAGRGTSVKIFLPLTQAPVHMSASTLEPIPVTSTLRRHILVVDDEGLVRQAAESMLKSAGHDVILVADGNQAVEVCSRIGHQIDLVILDMIMPGMNGRDTFRALKKILPEIKVLLASGHSPNEEVQTLLKEGACGFLQKPFDRSALGRAMDATLKF